MILQPDRATRLARGFTLLEMLIVLLILGLVAGLVLSRGPPHSAALDLRASATEVAGSLREARAQAIATQRPQSFILDLATHTYRLGTGSSHGMPPEVAIAITTVAGEVGRQIGRISFAPDGSSSGGRVQLAEGARRIEVGVDWLTGRVSIADAR